MSKKPAAGAQAHEIRAVLTGRALDVQPEALFGSLPARCQQALGQASQMGSQIAVAKPAPHRQHLDPNRTVEAS
jgi:hypothetical protein